MPHYVTDDGVSIHYEIDDHRDPWLDDEPETVLLHHGFIRNLTWWEAWVPPLSRRYRVLRLDVRGCGASSVPPDDADFSATRLMADARGLLDHLEIQRVHFIGHLSGAFVGQLLAVTHPERVRSLVLVAGPAVVNRSIREAYALGESDSLASMRRFGLPEWLARTNPARFDPATDPAVVAWHLREQAKTPFHVGYRLHEAFRSLDLRADLSHIEVPVLMIAPSDAPGISADELDEMRARVPRSQLVRVEGRGSDLSLTKSSICIAETLTFLEGLSEIEPGKETDSWSS
jgi:3-oxoadipate enol-lactonase